MREATHHTPTLLQFLPDWRTEQHGEITPGGKLLVEYDTGRLPILRQQRREADACNVEAYIRFHPTDELHKESLSGELKPSSGSPVTSHALRPLEVVVPKDATRVELWFRTFDDVGGFREAWDSQFGQNYWFDVAGRQEAATQHQQQAAPQHRQSAPPRHESSAPPQHQQEAPPQHQQEAPPQHQQEAPPQHQQEAPPQHRQSAPPQHQQQAAAPQREQHDVDSRPAVHQSSISSTAKRKRAK